MQQRQQPAAAGADPNAIKWAQFYERDPNAALQSGYTKAHYDAYLVTKSAAAVQVAPAAPTQAAAPQLSANDEKWARFYENDPAKAASSGYSKAHYDAYLQKKGGAAPAPAAPVQVAAAPAAPAQLSANDEKWARFYENDPATAATSGYTKAHYEDYQKKKAAL